MIPSLLDELKEGKFKLDRFESDEYGEYFTYKTESNWVLVLSHMRFPLFSTIYINGQIVNWFFARKIRRAIKEGLKHEK